MVRPTPETLRQRRHRNQHMMKAFALETCTRCGALRDDGEKLVCCNRGNCVIGENAFPLFPNEFQQLICSIENFREKSRELNMAVSFVTIGTKFSEDLQRTTGFVYRVDQRGPPTMYGLHGRTMHIVRNVLKNNTYSYLFPGAAALDAQHACQADIRKIRKFMIIHNVIAQKYRMAGKKKILRDLTIVLPEVEQRRIVEPFLLQRTDECVDAPPSMMYIAISKATHHRVFVSGMDRLCEVGAYPLIFPRGCGGWYFDKAAAVKNPTFANGKSINTILKYVKYVCWQCHDLINYFPTLFQQWVLDQFSRWQESAFAFLSHNSDILRGLKLRCAQFSNCDVMKKNRYGKIGRPFLLPASVPGSPAARRKEARNAMAVIVEFKNSSHFITFTSNPKWSEVYDALTAMGVPPEDQRPELYPSIVVRIYRQKRRQFLKLLRTGIAIPGCGKALFIQLVDEFQRRYWPHFHILCRLRTENDRPWTATMVDKGICARLFLYEECPLFIAKYRSYYGIHPSETAKLSPQEEKDIRMSKNCMCVAHETYNVVRSLMVHTCRVGVCIKTPGGPCEKFFPKKAGSTDTQVTRADERGTWHYRRPRQEDSNVVPYCPSLSRQFQCHINILMADGPLCANYMHNYQRKGCDYTTASIESVLESPQLEFSNFQRYRHVGFAEAFMRLNSMELQVNEPACTPLYVHLENEQFVCWDEEDTDEQIEEKRYKKETPLLRYFARNISLRSLTFAEYFSKYTLSGVCAEKQTASDDDNDDMDNTDNEAHGEPALPFTAKDDPSSLGLPWQSKVARKRTRRHICRLEVPSAYNSERHCLALILRNFPRSSFNACRTDESGVIHETFSQCAYALGIYSDFDEYECALRACINPNPNAWEGDNCTSVSLADPHSLRRRCFSSVTSRQIRTISLPRLAFCTRACTGSQSLSASCATATRITATA